MFNEFKPIPGYEGLYSVTTEGEIRNDKYNRMKYSTTLRSGQRTIVLYKNSVPRTYTIQSLVDLTYKNTPITTKENAAKSHSKKVKCIETNEVFNSYTEACQHFNFDYKRFREALEFDGFYKGKHFEKLCKGSCSR